MMQIFSQEFKGWVRRKPVRSLVVFVLAAAAFGVIGEFSVGVVNGFMEGISTR